MAIRIQLRRDTAANWSGTNPILGEGEIGIDLDDYSFKIGNGTDAWDDLTAFSGGGGGGTWGSITGTLSDQTDLQSELDAKEDSISATTSADYYRGDKTFQTLNKAAVGLSNVDNTTDAGKPVSTAQAAADAAAIVTAKAYADGLVVGLWDDRGSYDPTATSDYPATGGSGTAGALLKGDIFTISVAGTISGNIVSVGDTVRALVDTPGLTDANWDIQPVGIGYVPENIAHKDDTGGYAGLTLFKINFKNALNTFTSFFTNANTAARTYTFQDRNGTIADDTDLAAKISTSVLDTDGALTANSDAKIASQKATKTYADTKAALSHTHAATDITSGTLDGDRLPALDTTKKGGVPATGTPSGKFLKDDGTWSSIAGGGDLLSTNNLSDVANASTARTNLGINTTANQTDSSNKRFTTDAQQTILGNTSGTNSGNETVTTEGALINGATSKTTPVDADYVGLMDSAASNILKKLSWANLKATIATYLGWASNADGGQFTIGTTPRIFKFSGADITIVGSGSATMTFPSVSDTLVGNKSDPAAKCWAKIQGDGASILASYNITSITDTGGGDLAITIATDFSSAHWACVTGVERVNSTTTVTNDKKLVIKAGTQAAGTISLQCWDSTATNNVVEDPANYHFVGFGVQ